MEVGGRHMHMYVHSYCSAITVNYCLSNIFLAYTMYVTTYIGRRKYHNAQLFQWFKAVYNITKQSCAYYVLHDQKKTFLTPLCSIHFW